MSLPTLKPGDPILFHAKNTIMTTYQICIFSHINNDYFYFYRLFSLDVHRYLSYPKLRREPSPPMSTSSIYPSIPLDRLQPFSVLTHELDRDDRYLEFYHLELLPDYTLFSHMDQLDAHRKKLKSSSFVKTPVTDEEFDILHHYIYEHIFKPMFAPQTIETMPRITL